MQSPRGTGLRQVLAGLNATACGTGLRQLLSGLNATACGTGLRQVLAGLNATACGTGLRQVLAGLNATACGTGLRQVLSGLNATASRFLQSSRPSEEAVQLEVILVYIYIYTRRKTTIRTIKDPLVNVSSVDCGNTRITQHAFKVSKSSKC